MISRNVFQFKECDYMQDIKTYKQSDLVLRVNKVYDTNKLNLDEWKPFIDKLCGERTYQKEAIMNAIIYIIIDISM